MTRGMGVFIVSVITVRVCIRPLGGKTVENDAEKVSADHFKSTQRFFQILSAKLLRTHDDNHAPNMLGKNRGICNGKKRRRIDYHRVECLFQPCDQMFHLG